MNGYAFYVRLSLCAPWRCESSGGWVNWLSYFDFQRHDDGEVVPIGHSITDVTAGLFGVSLCVSRRTYKARGVGCEMNVFF